jgi:hypothetical protein
METIKDIPGAISKSVFGSRILLYEGDGWDSIYPHPKGCVVRVGNRFSLNGRILWDSPFELASIHNDGVLIKANGRYYLNGKTEISCPFGRPIPCFEAPCSVVRKKDRAGKTTALIFATEADKNDPAKVVESSGVQLTEGDWQAWEEHPFGALFVWAGKVVLVVSKPPKNSC